MSAYATGYDYTDNTGIPPRRRPAVVGFCVVCGEAVWDDEPHATTADAAAGTGGEYWCAEHVDAPA